MHSLLDVETQRAHRTQNALHSLLLLSGLGAIVIVCSLLLFGWAGLGWAAIMIGLMIVLLPRIPPEAIMRAYRARPLDPRQGDPLAELLVVLAERAALQAVPKLYVIPSGTLNAFAAGRPGHAAIGVTEGLLRRLTMREIAGVLAHEISHVRNNDLAVMSLADVLTRFAHGLSYAAIALAILNLFAAMQGEQHASWLAIAMLYLAPTVSSLMQLGLSRTREYDADLEAASLTGDPLGLASALRRLEHYTGRFWEDLVLPGRRVPHPSILRSHPSTDDRVQRLIALSGQPPLFPPLVISEAPMISLVGVGPVAMQPRYRFPGLWY